jgi:hypothetical protein
MRHRAGSRPRRHGLQRRERRRDRQRRAAVRPSRSRTLHRGPTEDRGLAVAEEQRGAATAFYASRPQPIQSQISEPGRLGERAAKRWIRRSPGAHLAYACHQGLVVCDAVRNTGGRARRARGRRGSHTSGSRTSSTRTSATSRSRVSATVPGAWVLGDRGARSSSISDGGGGTPYSRSTCRVSRALRPQRTPPESGPGRSTGKPEGLQARTSRSFWCARIFRLTRWSALSIVFVSQPRPSAISSYEFPSR